MISRSLMILLVLAPALLRSPLKAETVNAGVTFAASGEGRWTELPPLDQLMAPVALYPDPILALILPASTQPGDLQAAATGGERASDAAVAGLMHYPDVVQWMNSNQSWSEQMGNAFAEQPAQVFDAVQDLRRRAIAAGALQSNDQIEVVNSNGIVQILPRQADVVYVPRYDAGAVYFSGSAGISIGWGTGLPAGDWLGFYPAWDRHSIYTGDWYGYSRSHGGWAAKGSVGFTAMLSNSGLRNAHEWHMAQNAQIRSSQYHHAASGDRYARPQSMAASAGGRPEAAKAPDRRAAARPQSSGQHPATFSGDDYNPTAQAGRESGSQLKRENASDSHAAGKQGANDQQLYNRERSSQQSTAAEEPKDASEEQNRRTLEQGGHAASGHDDRAQEKQGASQNQPSEPSR